MYINVKFFKKDGKLSHVESIHPGFPEPFTHDTEKIEKMIINHFHPTSDYMWEAIDDTNNQYACRLVKF